MPHTNFNAPGHPNWYHCDGVCQDQPRGARYEFPLPCVEGAPSPSNADHSPQNVAWLIEFLAAIIAPAISGVTDHCDIALRYENNSPKIKKDDIIVEHPKDKLYWPDAHACNFGESSEMARYEIAAKKSQLLKLYMDHSPAQIEYFQPICDI